MYNLIYSRNLVMWKTIFWKSWCSGSSGK